ncbi:MAG: ABC transporter ATP-binding protein [Desulfatitalea sp.]|nr:ABC transporter ATP-binding protein [Desulfatitalea sp.]
MIEVDALSKTYSGVPAVEDLSFSVAKGEILGFLGPNGAGKSTTMRMITGFLTPDRGTVRVGGYDVVREPLAARRKIGYLPENAPVYEDMTVQSYLDFIARIRGFGGAQRKKRVDATMARCFLGDVRFQTIHTLSKGFKQRVCFAQSILHDPDYLVLDEPTDGLDPNQKHEVRQMIREMSVHKAIILSTHILDEMEAVCTRAIIIARGRLVVDETPERLRTRSPLHGAVSLSLAPCAVDELTARLQGVEGVDRVALLAAEGTGVTLRVFPRAPEVAIAEGIVRALGIGPFHIRSLFVEKGRLDEVFREITQTPPSATAH